MTSDSRESEGLAERMWIDPVSKEPAFYGEDHYTGYHDYAASDDPNPLPDAVEYIKADSLRCKHGVRWPHECSDCFHETFPDRAEQAATIAQQRQEIEILLVACEQKDIYAEGVVAERDDLLDQIEALKRERDMWIGRAWSCFQHIPDDMKAGDLQASEAEHAALKRERDEAREELRLWKQAAGAQANDSARYQAQIKTLRDELDQIKRQAEDATEYVLAMLLREQKEETAALRARCDELRNGWFAYKHHYEHFGGGDIRTGRAWDAMNRAALQGGQGE